MARNGFIGEYEDPISGRTIAIKNHWQDKMEFADGIILIIRNPYDAIIAEFNRKVSHRKRSIFYFKTEAFHHWGHNFTHYYITNQ